MQTSVQLGFLIIYLGLIVSGLAGIQVGGQNATTALIWTVWWIGVIFVVLLCGKIFCYLCPIAALGDWLQRGGLWRKTRESLFGLNLQWPHSLRNIYPAIVFFLAVTWIELGTGITSSPKGTAWLLIIFLVVAVVAAVLFAGRSFCRYACLVGRISGLYSLVAPVELRVRNRQMCSACRGKECVAGSDAGFGCPALIYPGSLQENTYCLLCMECLRTCSRNNIALNLRPFSSDLSALSRLQADEATLSIVMLVMTLFHIITMTPHWTYLSQGIQQTMDVVYTTAFTMGMVFFLVVPSLLVLGSSLAGRLLAGNRLVPAGQVILSYACPLLPVVLFFHLPHNVDHLFNEILLAVPVLSDPLGLGWNLFGTATWRPPTILSPNTIRIAQYSLTALATLWGIIVSFRVARHLFPDNRDAMRSLIPISTLIVALAIGILWLFASPMEMRMTGHMGG